MHSAGFVTFKKLSAVQSTLQTVQNEEPFAMQVVEAPDPNDGACHENAFDAQLECQVLTQPLLVQQSCGPT
jgi:hypothetical protein